jgi:NAD(P)-dependent dehydrogenase (short-subunit alcohol dehydrogenase family)
MDYPKNTIAITGGAAGIGLAAAKQWLAGGGQAFILDLNQDAIESAMENLGHHERARGLVCDITSTPSVQAAFEQIAASGDLHALVNCAGVMIPTPSAEVGDVDFAHLMDVHVLGAMRCCRAAYPLLQKTQGSIVNIASVAALVGMPHRAAYVSAKAAIGGLTRTLAVEWAPDGIRVNAVAPGYVRTAMTGDLIKLGKINMEKIEARTPLGRFAEPSEIAAPIIFLTSKGASFITGHTLFADGGMTIDGNWY